MKKIYILFCLSLFLVSCNATKKNDGNTDFELFYNHVNTPEDSYKYLKNASLNGHKEAMDHLLDRYLYRGNSLTLVKPKEIFKIYRKYLTKSDEKENEKLTEFLEKCAEVPDLNIKEFCKKYNIDITNEDFINEPYSVWQLAEEASKPDSRFGEPDSKLILQLILRGGEVPFEFQGAVNDFYNYYKAGEVHEFKIDDYVASGYGINFCSLRIEKILDEQFEEKVNQIAVKFNKENQEVFISAIKSYSEFVEEKIWSEEGNDGSGYITWALDSKHKQKDEFLNLFEKAFAKERIDSIEKTTDQLITELNELIQIRNSLLENSRIYGMYFEIDLESELKIDALWNSYTNKLFELVFSQFDLPTAESLKKWIFCKRIAEIKDVMYITKDYKRDRVK